MSISVMIGSNPKDIHKIQSTLNILNELKLLMTNEVSEPSTNLKHLEDLCKWYQNILNILYNGGSSTDFVLNP